MTSPPSRAARRLAAVAVMVTSALGGTAALTAGANERVDVATDGLRLAFAPPAIAPVLWQACRPSCAATDHGGGIARRFTGADDVPMPRVVLRGADGDPGSVPADVSVSETAAATVVTLTSALGGGLRFERSFAIARHGFEVTIAARVVGAGAAAFMHGRQIAVELDAGPGWPAVPGGWLTVGDELQRVAVSPEGVRRLADVARGPVRLAPTEWLGFRDRFWTMLVRAGDGASVELASSGPRAIVVASTSGATAVRHTVYAGPLDYGALGRADPDLRRLLFSGLWNWLRALGIGSLRLLDGLIALVGHPGPAIVLLAVAVKALLFPLTALAHRWQEQVDVARARLQPEIDAIKAAYRGEAQASRLLDLHRREGVHPLYTLKSLAGVLIQLPVFVAVFDMLAENVALDGVSFLGIHDLAQPDRLLALPLALPLVGSSINVLPFAMVVVSLVAAARFDASALPAALRSRQRRSLAGMAVLFFVLFYRFPAGMVLYWTSTNAVQLAVREARRLRGPRG